MDMYGRCYGLVLPKAHDTYLGYGSVIRILRSSYVGMHIRG